MATVGNGLCSRKTFSSDSHRSISQKQFFLLFGRFGTPDGIAVSLSLTLGGLQVFGTLAGLPKEL